ncbi:MAG: helix-turn-helix domain-containing protein [Muribaculaceae bacterium]|nr:helix-turn-helix domain-containing protein [Muribaculaceae bacterium]
MLHSLYSTFILELLNIENSFQPITDVNTHSTDLFLRFLKLVNEHFISHHDLNYYADALAVTTIYLSRVVKRLSNQTIKNHIDRLLTMEACFRLTNSDTPIAEIAEDLHFANPASFCKFFSRQKGVPPREYRNKFQ